MNIPPHLWLMWISLKRQSEKQAASSCKLWKQMYLGFNKNTVKVKTNWEPYLCLILEFPFVQLCTHWQGKHPAKKKLQRAYKERPGSKGQQWTTLWKTHADSSLRFLREQQEEYFLKVLSKAVNSYRCIHIHNVYEANLLICITDLS